MASSLYTLERSLHWHLFHSCRYIHIQLQFHFVTVNASSATAFHGKTPLINVEILFTEISPGGQWKALYGSAFSIIAATWPQASSLMAAYCALPHRHTHSHTQYVCACVELFNTCNNMLQPCAH